MNKELSKFTIKEVRKDIRKVFKEVKNPCCDNLRRKIYFELARNTFEKAILKLFK